MGWFRVDRSPRSERGRFLYPKMALFAQGAVLAALGMGMDRAWLVDAATVLLALGSALRFLRARTPPKE